MASKNRSSAIEAGPGSFLLPEPMDGKALRILHLGAGSRKVVGAVTVDINPRLTPDIVWDLNRFPYPLEDSSFDVVVCEHVIEHLEHVVSVMEEIHRVLRSGGRAWVRVPHFSSLNANTDPTHTRRFSSRSMDYFCVGTELEDYEYTSVRFRKLVARMTMRPMSPFDRFLMNLINNNLDLYEEHLSGIIPGQELLFVLETIK
jgi:SAM-dependent methyltransferase